MKLDLTKLGLTDEAREARAHSIGGSDASKIASGDPQKLMQLWMQKTGRAPERDMSDDLFAVMGHFTEPLNIAWFEKNTGLEVAGEQRVLKSDTDPWRTATVDGVVLHDADYDYAAAVFEAKHRSADIPLPMLLREHQPQLHHNMDVAGMKKAYLSILLGNADWVYFEVDYNVEYAARLKAQEWDFWMKVLADEPPGEMPALETPGAVNVVAHRIVDMTGNNAWAAYADTFLKHQEAAKSFEGAKSGLKELVEPDVAMASGHGVIVKRGKPQGPTLCKGCGAELKKGHGGSLAVKQDANDVE